MKNNAAVVAKSRVKEGCDEKTYRISLSNGLLEHCPYMLDSVWLFIWYIDRTTKETNGEGSVLGGIPIKDSRAASDLRMPVKTIRRWRLHLEAKGYISTVRTPYGHVITLLKSKKWKRGLVIVSPPDPTKRDLPNEEISPKENSQNGHREFPGRGDRIPAAGSQNSPNGKYKEDKAVDSTRRNSRHGSHLIADSASPLRTQPSGKGKKQLGMAQTRGEIARLMVIHRDTIADRLAMMAKSNYFVSSEEAQRRCGEAVDAFTLAFALISYPFDVSSSVLGWEFCENVKIVVGESRVELPRPKKWELCERVLDRCDKSWNEAEEYADVGLPYWPPNFNDHINHLFKLEEK